MSTLYVHVSPANVNELCIDICDSILPLVMALLYPPSQAGIADIHFCRCFLIFFQYLILSADDYFSAFVFRLLKAIMDLKRLIVECAYLLMTSDKKSYSYQEFASVFNIVSWIDENLV